MRALYDVGSLLCFNSEAIDYLKLINENVIELFVTNELSTARRSTVFDLRSRRFDVRSVFMVIHQELDADEIYIHTLLILPNGQVGWFMLYRDSMIFERLP